MEVAHLYDWLSRYVQYENLRAGRIGDRFAGFTMHKTLAPPQDTDIDDAGLQLVNALAIQAAALPPGAKALDAGCGWGGTIFRACELSDGRFDGVTLSAVQQRVATEEAARRGLSDRCRFHLRSYDEPPDRGYDAVIAIESLVHSPDIGRTLDGLLAALRPGGRLVVVEDVLRDALPPEDEAQAAILAEHWGCARLPRDGDYEGALDRAGFELVQARDLTDRVRPRPAEVLDPLEARYWRRYRWLPIKPVRTVLSAYIGGIALERLYLSGAARYRLIAARAPG